MSSPKGHRRRAASAGGTVTPGGAVIPTPQLDEAEGRGDDAADASREARGWGDVGEDDAAAEAARVRWLQEQRPPHYE
mgnify:CR=1 FL=1